jgi:hypothetical protein
LNLGYYADLKKRCYKFHSGLTLRIGKVEHRGEVSPGVERSEAHGQTEVGATALYIKLPGRAGMQKSKEVGAK